MPLAMRRCSGAGVSSRHLHVEALPAEAASFATASLPSSLGGVGVTFNGAPHRWSRCFHRAHIRSLAPRFPCLAAGQHQRPCQS